MNVYDILENDDDEFEIFQEKIGSDDDEYEKNRKNEFEIIRKKIGNSVTTCKQPDFEECNLKVLSKDNPTVEELDECKKKYCKTDREMCEEFVKDKWDCKVYQPSCKKKRNNELTKCEKFGYTKYKYLNADAFVDWLEKNFGKIEYVDYHSRLSQLRAYIMVIYQEGWSDGESRWNIIEINYILKAIRDKIIIKWINYEDEDEEDIKGGDIVNTYYLILLIDVFTSQSEKNKYAEFEKHVIEMMFNQIRDKRWFPYYNVYVDELRGILYALNGDKKGAKEKLDIAMDSHYEINNKLKEIHTKFTKDYLTLRVGKTSDNQNLEPPEKLQLKKEDDKSEFDKKSLIIWEKIGDRYEEKIDEVLEDFFVPDIGIPFTIQTK